MRHLYMFHTLIICNLELVLEPWIDFWLLYPKNHSPVPSSLHLPWVLPSPGGHLDPCSPHSCHGFMPSFFEYRHWELHRIFLHSTSSISLSAQGALCLLQRDEPALNLCSFKSFADTWIPHLWSCRSQRQVITGRISASPLLLQKTQNKAQACALWRLKS